jgi:cytochrome P450
VDYGFSLSDPGFWSGDRTYRDEAFRTLRDLPGLAFFEERSPDPSYPAGPGYWAATRYEDVWSVSRQPQVFHSYPTTDIEDALDEVLQYFPSLLLNLDDPMHARLRALISRGFTPRAISRLEIDIKFEAKKTIDRVLTEHPRGACDFVQSIAAPLPLRVICAMLGIPSTDFERVLSWTSIFIRASDLGVAGSDDEEPLSLEDVILASQEITEYAAWMAKERVDSPREDLTSALMHAEIDGDRLRPDEFAAFVSLLVVAGNETTRNAISHGIKILTDNPDQLDLFYSDFEAYRQGAIEEIVRWASPIIHMRRTASEDTEIAGQKIAAGDKVVMWYLSANRDERVFSDPFKFDVKRPQVPAQFGFGAGGPHFCLGANLARAEIAAMFDELRRRVPSLRATGEPEYVNSWFVDGIRHLPCAWNA